MAYNGICSLNDKERTWELLQMINPINHGDAETIAKYKVEPYVMAADIYAEPLHKGWLDMVHRFCRMDVQLIIKYFLG